MRRRRATAALPRDPSSRFLPWIVALMVLLAALALAGALALRSAVERWDRGLSGTITVQVPPAADEKATDARVARTVEILSATPGVVVVEPLARDRLLALLEPWIDAETAAGLPIPRLIDIRVRPGARVDPAPLQARLTAVAQGITVDDHQAWLGSLLAFARTMEFTAFAVVGLIGIVAVATVIFVTLARMAIHRPVIDLLHLMGATDGYIARQFQGLALRWGLAGGIIGLAAAAAALLAIGEAGSRLGELLPVPRLTPGEWALLLILPGLSGLIAMLTARLTVLTRLKRTP